MKICVIGAGAMGGLYGCRMLLSGNDVQFIEAQMDAVNALNTGVYLFEDLNSEHHIKAPAAPASTGLEPVDIAFIHTDTNNTAAAGEHANNILKPNGWAVTFQNGVGNVEILRKILGEDRVVGGISYHSAASPSPGRAIHTNANKTWIGELNGRSTDRITLLRDILRKANFEVFISDQIQSVIWTKFVLNCCVNPISAITGLRSGEVGSDTSARELQEQILEETLEVIEAKGITLIDLDPRESIKRMVGKAFNKPSMLQHMEAGLQTEIDSLNGVVIREGDKLGIPTPYNHALTMMIKSRNAHVIRSLGTSSVDSQIIENKDCGKELT